MRNLIILLFVIFYSCGGHSSPIVLDDNFIEIDHSKEFPYSKLVGKYEADSISKKRFNIPIDKPIIIEIHSDTTFIAKNYLDYKTDSLLLKKLKGRLLYTNDFKDSFLNFGIRDGKFNGGGGLNIYYRKKDSVLALLVFMPPIPATEENNMQYREGDYLRYIKVKDSVNK